MPQTLAPFHLEHTTSTGTVTARGGAALLLEAFYATGLHEASRSIRRRPNRGYDDADHVLPPGWSRFHQKQSSKKAPKGLLEEVQLRNLRIEGNGDVICVELEICYN